MEIRQLRYFEAVARTLNFSRAAEQLHIAQPPLSRQIQQLEQELGVQLLDRSSRPMQLTNAGVFFYEQSVQVLARLAEIKDATRRISEGGRRWMGVGFVPSVLYGFLPKILRQFALDHAQLDMALQELTSVQQAEALKSGRIDMGFGRLAIPDAALTNVVLLEEPLVVAVPSPGPLSALPDLALKDLLRETLILYPVAPRPSFADQVLRHFHVRGLQVRDVMETNGLQTAVGLVAAGMGVTIVPASVRRLGRTDVAYVPLSDAGVTSPLIMTFHEGDNSTHVSALREQIEAAAGLARREGFAEAV